MRPSRSFVMALTAGRPDRRQISLRGPEIGARDLAAREGPAERTARHRQARPHPIRRFLPLTLALTLFLTTLAPGFAAEPAWIERRVGALGVPLPAGAGWVQTQRDGGIWVASRVRRTVAGDAQFLYLALIEGQKVSAAFADWSPDRLAAQYLDWAVEDLTEDGVETGAYALTIRDRSAETHGTHTLYVLRVLKDYVDPWHPDLRLEAQELYLVIPPDFATNRTFYKILFTADCFFDGCIASDLDLSALHPLLDRLRDYSVPSM